MRRRRTDDDEHENHERWLVSYADFITLLFAFFVVMYAISSVNEGKYRVLSQSLGNAFGQKVPAAAPAPPPAVVQPILPLPRKSRNAELLRHEREQMTDIARDILKALAPLVQQGKVRVMQTSRGVTVDINASVLFAPGEAKLAESSIQALKAVAAVLRRDRHAVRIEGHTDNVPISTAFFPSNWELSAVRASSVVRLFADSGIAENRLMAVGYGDTRPVDDNRTADGRLRNRRVQIMILASLPDKAVDVPVSMEDEGDETAKP